MTKPRVFLTVSLMEGRAYYANLEQFGELTYLYERIPNIWAEDLEDDIVDRAEALEFDPILDFFAVSGIMPLACVTLAVLVEEFGAIKTLLWDKEKHFYREKVIGGLEECLKDS